MNYQICVIHKEIEKFICFDCARNYCSDCLLFTDHDKSHTVCPRKNLNNKYVKELLQQNQILEDNYKLLNSDELEKQLDKKIEELTKLKEEQVTFYKKLSFCLQERYRELIDGLTKIKKEINKKKLKIKDIQKFIKITLKSLVKKTKKADEIDEDITQITNESDILIYNLQNKINLLRCSMTPISTGMDKIKIHYVIKNFTKLSKDSTIFSPYYKLNFLTWQFLIYPNGYGDLKGKYLSIFLGLKEGDKNAIYPYSYSIELINVKSGKNFVTNSYDYDFQEGGNFTGLSNFYLLQSLEKDGFISKNNEIEFNLYLWPKNIEKEIDYYYNQCYASYNEKEIEEINKYFSA